MPIHASYRVSFSLWLICIKENINRRGEWYLKEKDQNSLIKKRESPKTLESYNLSVDQVNSNLDSLKTLKLPSETAMSIAEKLNSFNLSVDQANSISDPLKTFRLTSETAMSITEKLKSFNLSEDQANSISDPLKTFRLASETAMSIAGKLKSYNLSVGQADSIGDSLKTFRMPSINNTEWVLSNSVKKGMSLIDEERDSKKIFSKIPKDKYDLNQQYNSESKVLEYILQNKENKDSIPLKDIPTTIAITDIIKSLSSVEAFEFYNHLVKYPMLGLQHRVGRKILNEIKEVKLRTFEKLVLYRVRDRNIKKECLPFTDIEMFEAPYGMASHGRFNVIGQGELYTSSNREVALKEVAKENHEIRYDIITWELQKPVSLLDLSSYDSPFEKYISSEKKTSNNQQYLVPNFLSQCVKFHEITGISYNSVMDRGEMNFVFFDFEKGWFKTVRREVNIEYKSKVLQEVVTN